MGCSSCGGRALPPRSGERRVYPPSVDTDCAYSLELMDVWMNKLLCIRQNDLYSELGITKYKINSAVGIVQSALNTGNACIFARSLDEINGIILALINSGKCQ